MSNVTIYDVAQEAKVSIATVSRVLNSPSKVNPETRQHVLAAIDKLKFVPKAEASARARRQNQRIGVLAPFFLYPSFVQRVRGIASVLDSTSYEMIIYNADTANQCHTYLESLPVAKRLDGLIVISLLLDDNVVERFETYDLPVVMIETSHPALSSVEIDNKAGGNLAAEYLLSRGHAHFVFVGGDIEIPGYTMRTSEMRLVGYQEGLQQADISLPASSIRWTEHEMVLAEEEAHRLFDEVSLPVAILAGNDTLALGILRAARKRNLDVPNEVAIVGFDDLDIAEYVGLTTVNQSLDNSGRTAVELLLGHLNDPSRPIQHVRLPLNIVSRDTA